jgi:hypothetical protein
LTLHTNKGTLSSRLSDKNRTSQNSTRLPLRRPCRANLYSKRISQWPVQHPHNYQGRTSSLGALQSCLTNPSEYGDQRVPSLRSG